MSCLSPNHLLELIFSLSLLHILLQLPWPCCSLNTDELIPKLRVLIITFPLLECSILRVSTTGYSSFKSLPLTTLPKRTPTLHPYF